MNDIVKENSSRRKFVAKVSVVFLGVMVLLTFFSNTINNFSLPRVKTEQPVSSALLKEVSMSGTVSAKDTVKVYSQSSGNIQDVFFKAGDYVKRGDTLILLDTQELEENLKEQSILLDKSKLSLEKLLNTPEDENSNDTDREVSAAEKKADEAQQELDEAQSQYESDIISKSELEKAQKALDDAQSDYEQKLEDLDAKKNDNLKKSKEHDKELKMDIADRQYDIQLQQAKVDSIKKQLAKGNKTFAPCSGIIKQMNFEKGAAISEGSSVCSIINTMKGYEIKASIDTESTSFLRLGDIAEISFDPDDSKTIKGRLMEISTSTNRGKTDLKVSVPVKGVTGGETGEITFSKKTKAYDILVPNSCVGTDDKGRFVYTLKEKKGPLGNEHYVQRVSVIVEDHDNFKSAVKGITSDEEVVVYSSKDDLSDGCRVMLER